MKLKNIAGRLVDKNVNKYRVDWNKKSRSKYQFSFKKFLEQHIKTHIVYEEFPVYGSRMTLDFYDATSKVAYEVQGEQHQTFNKFYHNNSRLKYLSQIKRDMGKSDWCELNTIRLVEIYPEDLDKLSRGYFIEKFNIYL